MGSIRTLLKDSSGLGEGVATRTHFLNLGSGTGTGTTIIGGDKSIDKGQMISGNIDQILSANSSRLLTSEKGVIMSASITYSLEGEICQS